MALHSANIKRFAHPPETGQPTLSMTTRSSKIQHISEISEQGATSQGATDSESPTSVMKPFASHIIRGTEFDSPTRSPPPRCHPDTRKSIIERIQHWLLNAKRKKRVLWLVGPPGVGKSAIMQTLSEFAATSPKVVLGATLFFSKVSKRNSPSRVFPTLAYQLAIRHSLYREYILREMAANLLLSEMSITKQFETLIKKPFVQERIFEGQNSLLVLLDGLNECDGDLAQREIIQLICSFSLSYPNAALIWVIASRPEPHLRAQLSDYEVIMFSYLKMEVAAQSDEARADVERFLRHEFERIQQGDHSSPPPPKWPTESELLKIAAASGGLFVYASTVTRFIGDPALASPSSRLEQVLTVFDSTPASSSFRFGFDPLAQLDALYTGILSWIPKDMLPEIRLLLTNHLALQRGNIMFNTLAFLCNWVGLTFNDAYGSLFLLRSTLDVPHQDAEKKGLNFHHLSFCEYLKNPAHSFHISDYDMDKQELGCSLRILKEAHLGTSSETGVAVSISNVVLSCPVTDTKAMHENLYNHAGWAFTEIINRSSPDSVLPYLLDPAVALILKTINIPALRALFDTDSRIVQFLHHVRYKLNPQIRAEFNKMQLLREVPVAALCTDNIKYGKNIFVHCECDSKDIPRRGASFREAVGPLQIDYRSKYKYWWCSKSNADSSGADHRLVLDDLRLAEAHSPDMPVLLFGNVTFTFLIYDFTTPDRSEHWTYFIEMKRESIPGFELESSTLDPLFLHSDTHAHPKPNKSTALPGQFRFGPPALKILRDMITSIGIADLPGRYPPLLCYPGTRMALIERAQKWVLDDQRMWDIFWLHGLSGVGKSTLARTITQYALEKGRLGAVSFFSRRNGSNNPDQVFIALAYQLFINVPGYSSLVAEQLAVDPDLLAKTPQVQFKKLIVEPMSLLQSQYKYLVVLDSLDECNGEEAQLDIIELINNSVICSPSLPIIWMICSEPAPHLVDTFSRADYAIQCWRENVDIHSQESQEDTAIFIRGRFKAMHETGDEYKMGESSTTEKYCGAIRPSESDTTQIINAVSGLFVLASTICKYIDGPEVGERDARLTEILSAIQQSHGAGRSRPMEILDLLYTRILSKVPWDIWPTTCRLLEVVTDQVSTLRAKTPQFLYNFMQITRRQFYAIVLKLRAVLDVPVPEDADDWPLHFHHMSFLDYLVDPNRSGRFCITRSEFDACDEIQKSSLAFIGSINCFLAGSLNPSAFGTQPEASKSTQAEAHVNRMLSDSLSWPSLDPAVNREVARVLSCIACSNVFSSYAKFKREEDHRELIHQLRVFDYNALAFTPYSWDAIYRELPHFICWTKTTSLKDLVRTHSASETDDKLLMYLKRPGVDAKPLDMDTIFAHKTFDRFPQPGYFLLGYATNTVLVLVERRIGWVCTGIKYHTVKSALEIWPSLAGLSDHSDVPVPESHGMKSLASLHLQEPKKLPPPSDPIPPKEDKTGHGGSVSSNQLYTACDRLGLRLRRGEEVATGPQERPTWTCTFYINDSAYGTGSGPTKGRAWDQAAKNALGTLGASHVGYF